MVAEKTCWLASKHLPEKHFQKSKINLLDWPTAAQADAGAAHRKVQAPVHHHQSPAQHKENGDPFLFWMETPKMLP